MTKRQLVLENGSVYHGKSFGAEQSTSGEVIFNTSMTGYQEVISDPAYHGQIVMFTYPLVGNYGINLDDFETVNPLINGIIVKEACEHPSNFRYDETLHDYLNANDIPGITGIDTRKLMRELRKDGTMKGCITTTEQPVTDIVNQLKMQNNGRNFVQEIAIQKPYIIPGRGKRVVVVDLGMKHGILRALTKRNCHITVVPYNYTAEKILRLKPDGILVTSGPGNPMLQHEVITMVKEVLSKVPFFGIGLGHQIFALACGAKVEKMKTAHSGSSYPVKDIQRAQTLMTTQNHQYTVTKKSLADTDLSISHINLNDELVEGLKSHQTQAFSVQFYPESTPGPDDSEYLFDHFLQMMTRKEHKNV